MKIALVKTDFGLIPAYNSDSEIIKKFAKGEIIECSVKKARNIKFHRKAFALFNLVFENQERFENLDHLRKYITIKAGFYDEIETGKGLMILPKSIKFEKMDNITFEDFYNKCLGVIEREFLIDSDVINENLGDFF
jgi:hypothetical protein